MRPVSKEFILKPGLDITDFKVGDIVVPYRMGYKVKMKIVELCNRRERILTDDGVCWEPHELWPDRYDDNTGAIYVDFDNTLCRYIADSEEFGPPKTTILLYVRHLIEHGYIVKLFTARVSWKNYDKQKLIDWCMKYIGQEIEITNVKSHDCIMIIDDRAHNVRDIEKAINGRY